LCIFNAELSDKHWEEVIELIMLNIEGLWFLKCNKYICIPLDIIDTCAQTATVFVACSSEDKVLAPIVATMELNEKELMKMTVVMEINVPGEIVIRK